MMSLQMPEMPFLDQAPITDAEFQAAIDKFTHEEIQVKIDDATGLVFAGIPARNLSAYGEDPQQALFQLAKEYIQLVAKSHLL